jgi:hypothetical protein
MMKTLTKILVLLAFIAPILRDDRAIQAGTITSNCVRSTPTAIVKKSVFPKTKFILKKIDDDGQAIPTGIETVIFNNGDRLNIINSGCEMFSLKFRFETSQIDRKMKDKKYLYNRSAWLMTQVLPGLKSSLNLTGGITALKNYGAKQISPEIGKEIDYGDPEIRSVVKISKIEQLPNNKLAVEILFYYGPL